MIGNCLSNHVSCTTETRAPLPKRVIDVGPNDGSQLPRLYETQREAVAYATLTYCWGKSQPLRTKRENLKRMVQSINWQDIPRTIQDAIQITRALDLRYLWVDALCIVQDDEEDWQSQAPQMGAIYSRSFVTISAAEASSSDGGILRPRKFHEITGQIASEEAHTVTVFSCPSPDYSQFAVQHSFINSLYPIFSRGWCFQERVLAKRVLHFTSAGIIFECNEICFENGVWAAIPHQNLYKRSLSSILTRPTSTNGHHSQTMTTHRSRRKVFERFLSIICRTASPPMALNDDNDGIQEANELWHRLVEQYSAKHLTVARDVLPALSAAAQQTKNWVLGEYLAGVWSGYFLENIIWEAKLKQMSTRPSEYRAPSFSWASTIGPITYRATPDGAESRITILRVRCHPKSKMYPFGEVKSGYLIATGQLITAQFHPRTCTCRTRQEWEETSCHVFRHGHRVQDFQIDTIDDAMDAVGKEVFCLLMMASDDWEYPSLRVGWEKPTTALFLKRSRRIKGAFERIGVSREVEVTFFEGSIQQKIKII